MSAQTKDYVAHAHHLGRVQYVASVIGWDGDERSYHGQRTFPNAGLAKAWAARTAANIGDPDGSGLKVWPEVRRGTWETDRFYDGEYGMITDAEWAEDDGWFCDGWINDDGICEWTEDPS